MKLLEFRGTFGSYNFFGLGDVAAWLPYPKASNTLTARIEVFAPIKQTVTQLGLKFIWYDKKFSI